MREQGVTLGLNSGSDWSITGRYGQRYTIEEARKLWEDGRVTDYNLAFHRLVQSGWDVEKVKADLAELDRQRRPSTVK